MSIEIVRGYRKNARWVLGLLLSLAGTACLSGCLVGPDYKKPQLDMPTNYAEQPQIKQARTWWNSFNDPELNSLLERAVKANTNLLAAESRIRQARAVYTETASQEYPGLTATGAYSRSRPSQNAPSVTGAEGPNVASMDNFQAGFDAAWEIDVFGGVRRTIEAAGYNVEASIEDRRDAMVTLLAEVARAYIDLRGFQRQLGITQENIKAQRDTLELTKTKQRAGLSSDLDVAQSEALVYQTESTMPTLETGIRQSAYLIAILLAEEPMALDKELLTSEPIPNSDVPGIPLGLPSDLLRRRADVRRAERQLAAATANIGVAVAQLYPQFSLTGSLGLQSGNSKDFFSWPSRYWSIGPSVSWPVLDWGKIQASIKVQNELAEQAFLTYKQAVLNSLQDVDNSLVAYTRERQRQTSLVGAVDANKRAVELSLKLYTKGGLIDFLTVLDAERQLFAAQDALAQSQHDAVADLVSLYKALGGGWEDMDAQLQAAATQPTTQPTTLPAMTGAVVETAK